MKELNRYGVKQYSFAKILNVTESTVEIEAVQPKTREQKTRERETGIVEPDKVIEVSIPCDTIVVAAGSAPNDKLYETLKADFPNDIYNIGDSLQIGKVSDAISQAIELARKL